MTGPDRDLLDIQDDALLLDAVAGRGDLSAFRDDPIAALLGSYVADVDLDLDLPSGGDWRVKDRPPLAAPRRPARHARFLVAAGTAVALVGTSGVAAAVTGDPFSPYRAAVNAVTHSGGTTPTADGKGDAGGGDPSQASDTATVAHSLKAINRAIASGDFALAQQLLDDAQAKAGMITGVPPGLAHHLAALQHTIDGGAANGHGSGAQGKGGTHSHGSNKGGNGGSQSGGSNKGGNGGSQSGGSNKGGNGGSQSGGSNKGGNSGTKTSSGNKNPTAGPTPSTGGQGKGGSSKGRPAKSDSGATHGSGSGEPTPSTKPTKPGKPTP